MNGKWTPGPWHVADSVRCNGERLIRDSRIPPQLVATVVESDREYTAGSNARLIVAAPDMLEALEGLLDLLTETEPNGFPEGTWAGRQIEAAVAALAKARGES